MTTQNNEVARLREALLSAALDYHGADGGKFGPNRGWWGTQLAIRADLYGKAVRRAENAEHDTIPAPPPEVAEDEEETVYDAQGAEGVGR